MCVCLMTSDPWFQHENPSKHHLSKGTKCEVTGKPANLMGLHHSNHFLFLSSMFLFLHTVISLNNNSSTPSFISDIITLMIIITTFFVLVIIICIITTWWSWWSSSHHHNHHNHLAQSSSWPWTKLHNAVYAIYSKYM